MQTTCCKSFDHYPRLNQWKISNFRLTYRWLKSENVYLLQRLKISGYVEICFIGELLLIFLKFSVDVSKGKQKTITITCKRIKGEEGFLLMQCKFNR